MFKVATSVCIFSFLITFSDETYSYQVVSRGLGSTKQSIQNSEIVQSIPTEAISPGEIQVPQESLPPSRTPLPSVEPTLPIPSVPSPLSPSEPNLPDAAIDDAQQGICIRRFEVIGSTVFEAEALAQIAEDAALKRDTPHCISPNSDTPDGYELSFEQVLDARSEITQLYLDKNFTTSGAYIPEQRLENGIVTIKVIEGYLEDIQVTGLQWLNPNYVSSRLELASHPPLNVDRLLEGLQLLQLDPLIENIKAELSPGLAPGSSLLQVQATEADAFETPLILDNNGFTSIGVFRRQVQINHNNLLGQGDRLNLGYTNTDGSDTLKLSYSWPLNPRNGRLTFSYGRNWSRLTQSPLDEIFNLEAQLRYYELTLRQPIIQTPAEELSLSLTASFPESEATFNPLGTGKVPFISRGANEQGRLRISALRFAQEWSQRSDRQVIALRSQFNWGLNVLNSTVNEKSPDGQFFTWRGQGQWVYALAPDTLFLLRGDLQLADRPLAYLEQTCIGGQETVRGYRRCALLTDSGVLTSAEFRLPLYRSSEIDGLLQIAPFIDFGLGWDLDGDALKPNDPNTLVGLGVGLLWQQSDRLTARLDWGIPLISVDRIGDTLQEQGLYFSLVFTPF